MPKYVVWSVLFLPRLATGQGETTSAVDGQVLDQAGAGMAGVAVTIHSTENGLTRSLHTDDAGRFNFPQLRPGNYEVSVQAEGFAPQRRESVAAGLGQTQTVN